VVDGCGAQVLRFSPLGGLVVALPVPSGEVVEAVRELERVARSFLVVDGTRTWPVISLGVRPVGPGDLAADVLREARGAMLTAQRQAPGTTRWSDETTGTEPDQLSLVDDLATALFDDPGQLGLAFQPVYDIRASRVAGAEALLRWTHPDRGPVSPLLAVRSAERSGLVQELGTLVLDRALDQLVAWGRPRDFTLHVNVSPLQPRVGGFADSVAESLDRHGVHPGQLLLEMTESALMTGDAEVLLTLVDLRDHGVRLGIDDFGTGYSSIGHLLRLPVDTIKVDRSLVSDIGISPPAFELLKAVLGLLATTEVSVVAEGVETALQSAHLRTLGCRWAQGYHLGRPVAPEAFPAL
jgi:EAL domain-containing protein (putative c-di-GMP-specific phosphodiesterase class I)